MAVNMGFPADGVDNQGWKLYLTSLIMILSAGLFVIARVLTRVRIFELKADDYAIIASLVSQKEAESRVLRYRPAPKLTGIDVLYLPVCSDSACCRVWLREAY